MPYPFTAYVGVATHIFSTPPAPRSMDIPSSVSGEFSLNKSTTFSSITTVTFSSYSSTLNGEHLAGTRELEVASAGGYAAGEAVLIGENADDVKPVVAEVSSFSGTTLKLKEPLPKGFASGALVRGWSARVEFTAGELASGGTVEARLRGGTPYGELRWTLTGYASNFPITMPIHAGNVGRVVPDVHRLRYSEDEDLSEIIERAWWHRVVADIELNRLNFWQIRDTGRLARLHGAAIHLELVVGDARPGNSEHYDKISREYEKALERALDGSEAWFESAA